MTKFRPIAVTEFGGVAKKILATNGKHRSDLESTKGMVVRFVLDDAFWLRIRSKYYIPK